MAGWYDTRCRGYGVDIFCDKGVMMLIDLNDLIPDAIEPYLAAKGECSKRGLDLVETCVKRELIHQAALFAQGRCKYGEIIRLRQKAGLWVIGEEESSHIVTWRFTSTHIPEFADAGGKSRAVDFALTRNIGGVNKAHWNLKVDVNGNDEPDYIEAGKIFEDHGFISGRHYKDYCHIEWPK